MSDNTNVLAVSKHLLLTSNTEILRSNLPEKRNNIFSFSAGGFLSHVSETAGSWYYSPHSAANKYSLVT